MKTDIEYLTLVETTCEQAAQREQWKKPLRRCRRARSSGIGWGAFAAAMIGILVVAGLIGLLVTNGGLGELGERRSAARVQRRR